MSEYLIINISIISIPLLLSFEKNISYYKKLLPLFYSILIVSSVYIIWDVMATERGDWAFNPNYLQGIYFFNLPVEEILFFITVPYSIIFIFETFSFYLKEKILKIHPLIFVLAGLVFFILSYCFRDNNYTATVLAFCGVFFILSVIFIPDLLRSSIFWITILVSYLPFLVVNYILTSLPIVTYGEDAILGERFLTIPFEDFFYSFSMISLWIFVYTAFSGKFRSVFK